MPTQFDTAENSGIQLSHLIAPQQLVINMNDEFNENCTKSALDELPTTADQDSDKHDEHEHDEHDGDEGEEREGEHRDEDEFDSDHEFEDDESYSIEDAMAEIQAAGSEIVQP